MTHQRAVNPRLLPFALLLALGFRASAQVDSILVYRSHSSIVIDGIANDLAWKSTQSYFVNENPDPSKKPQSTQIKMVYDSMFLYLFFEAFDIDILGKHTTRDSPTY